MKKRSAFFAVALAAVLAVGTPATAVQEVVVGVRIVKSNINCALVPPLDGKPVKVGTAEFRAEFRAALEFTASLFRELDCGVALVTVTPL